MSFEIEAARSLARRVEPADPDRLHETIAALARPRRAGTEGAIATETELRTRFEQLGYGMRRLEFSFSTWPGRYGLSLAGVLVALAGAGAGWLLLAGRPAAAVATLVAGVALSTLPLLFLDRALASLPWGRVEAANLLFSRGRRPAWIVMAHRDSKSQPASTLVRTAALSAAALGCLALLGLSIARLAGAGPIPALAVTAAGVAGLAGAVLALGWAGNRSPGALDNASGLAVMLELARRTDGPEVAYLVTDGEELGLAGARVVAGRLPAVQGVINLDGLDDRGRIRVAEGHGWRRKGSAPQLAAAVLSAARALDMDADRRPLPRSVPVDHQPLAAAGIPALTVLRGDWRSLARVHRPTDEPDVMSGAGAAATATLMTVALRLLRDSQAAHLAAGQGHGS